LDKRRLGMIADAVACADKANFTASRL